MRILLVNDDGIRAPGLAALRSAVADLGEVTVVAPETPQSATGRSLTLTDPIACRRVQVSGTFWGLAVAGRPVDCVKLAWRELMDHKPEIVLSGINAGANVGINVFYSGTVAAAAEGALFGVPAVAFSLAGGGDMDFPQAAGLCRWVLDGLLAAGLGAGDVVNVNIPALWRGRPGGVKVVPQGTAAIIESYEKVRGAETGEVLFKLTDYFEHGPEDEESDVFALAEGYITVTPLHSDLTDPARLASLRRCDWGRLPAEARRAGEPPRPSS